MATVGASRASSSTFGEEFVRRTQSSHGTLTSTALSTRLLTDASSVGSQPTPPPAGAPDMWTWPHVGIYAHYACIGVVNGILSQALLPYCMYRSGGQPSTCATLSTFVNLPWGFKICYGLLSDALPLRTITVHNGRLALTAPLHRKPYLVLGWSATWAIAFSFATLPDSEVSLTFAALLFLLMTLAFLTADCAADAALVGYSSREPDAVHIQYHLLGRISGTPQG